MGNSMDEQEKFLRDMLDQKRGSKPVLPPPEPPQLPIAHAIALVPLIFVGFYFAATLNQETQTTLKLAATALWMGSAVTLYFQYQQYIKAKAQYDKETQ